MSSRRYKSYKFLYDDDRGRQIIKRHRSYLNADGVTEDTPTTQLFLDRVVNIDEKVTGTSQGLRHVLSYVGERRLQAKIPYSPGDVNLNNHVEEILAQPQVDCGDYVGERLITGGSTNSIQ
ncbi:MAG: hypothetical protein AAF298_28850 [Cyanobacteria bacterium P01_A01_bin.40]